MAFWFESRFHPHTRVISKNNINIICGVYFNDSIPFSIFKIRPKIADLQRVKADENLNYGITETLRL